MKVRLANTDDISTLVAFNFAMALETENLQLDKTRLRQGVSRVFENSEYGFYIIVEDAGVSVASLMITYEWSDWRNGLFWWIQSVYVLASARRQGVYKKMYAFIKTLAQQHPEVCGYRLYVEHQNTKAQRTYQSLGMAKNHYHIYQQLVEPVK